MKLYLNCYVVGEGYTLKRAIWPNAPQLEEISRQQLPELERNIFSGPDAPHLFLGDINNFRFGCVRNLETGMTDENGRRCFLHIAFESSGEDAAFGEDAALIDHLLMFALDCRSRFTSLCTKLVAYRDGDYQLVPKGVSELLDIVQSQPTKPGPSGILVPENLPESFFQNSGVAAKDIQKVLSLNEWKMREEFPLELFLYCSTPSSGFTLCQINPFSGGKMETGAVANSRMLPYAQIILNNSGASMALFREGDRIGFIAKGIQSVTADHYGRKKKMSIILQASNDQSLQIRQLAAWALLDHEAFSSQLTDCVNVYDGPRGFEVSGEKISKLLDQFSRKIAFPEGLRRQAWNKVLDTDGKKQFCYFVSETSLDYFCRIARVDLTVNDISWLISKTEFEQMQNPPANLEFKPELYKEPVRSNTGDVPVTKTSQETTAVKKSAVAAEPTPKPSSPVNQTEQKEGLATQRSGVQPVSLEGSHEQTKGKQWDERGDPDEYIDLLKTKWFLPVAAVSIFAVVGVVVLWLYMGS